MKNEMFDRAVTQLLERGSPYPRAAYDLMPIVLEYTVAAVKFAAREDADPEEEPPSRHVSGRDLSMGFKSFLLNEYGPFAADVLEALNITCTADIGRLVYDLIDVGCFGKSENDRFEDFENVYDFHEAFVAPYEVKDPTYVKEEVCDEDRLV